MDLFNKQVTLSFNADALRAVLPESYEDDTTWWESGNVTGRVCHVMHNKEQEVLTEPVEENLHITIVFSTGNDTIDNGYGYFSIVDNPNPNPTESFVLNSLGEFEIETRIGASLVQA